MPPKSKWFLHRGQPRGQFSDHWLRMFEIESLCSHSDSSISCISSFYAPFFNPHGSTSWVKPSYLAPWYKSKSAPPLSGKYIHSPFIVINFTMNLGFKWTLELSLKSFLDSILLSIVITSKLLIFRDLKSSNSFYGFCFKYSIVYIFYNSLFSLPLNQFKKSVPIKIYFQ